MRSAITAIALLAITACSESVATEAQDPFGYAERETVEQTSGFKGFSCRDDCSGHEAGYDWAESNDITHEDQCDGNSDSFNEGCTAYVYDHPAKELDEDGDRELGLF